MPSIFLIYFDLKLVLSTKICFFSFQTKVDQLDQMNQSDQNELNEPN